MNHKTVQKKLVLYIDNLLSEKEMNIISDHLKTCPLCSEKHKKIKKIWGEKRILTFPEPAVYLWNNLSKRIIEDSKEEIAGSAVINKMALSLKFALLMILFISAVFFGVSLSSNMKKDFFTQSDFYAETEKEKFYGSIYIDYISEVPPSSLEILYDDLKIKE